MNKKMRFLAGTLSLIMTVRYSELGMLTANAESYGNTIYQKESRTWHSMIADDIDLFYGALYQEGINRTGTELSYGDAIQGMLYDRGEFVDYYNSFAENTQPETDLYSNSGIIINSPNTSLAYILGSRLSQQINGETFEETETGVLYSASGDITINAGDVTIAGLIHAPQGTVTINAETVELTGLIAAEHIIVNAGTIKEQPAKDFKEIYGELEIGFYPEILATCGENNQVEIYGGNINIKHMDIYTRENNAAVFQKTGETAGNEYTFVLPEETDTMDIYVECTNIFGQTALSDIATISRTEGIPGNTVADSDGDGLPDGYEIRDLGTDPCNPDSDGDGLTDGYEILCAHTDPLTADSSTDRDGDGLTAQEEYAGGTNPLYADTDFDGISDLEDEAPLTTEILADQTAYQQYDFEPEPGFYDHKKVFLDIYGNRQVQIYNEITKEEYYDDNGGNIFLRVSDAGEQVESVIFSSGEETDIETCEYDNQGRKTTWAVNGNVYQYQYEDAGNTAETYLNGNFHNKITYDDKDNPIRMEYANEDVLDYEYDADSQVQSVSINGEMAYQYEYEEDRLVKVEDLRNNTVCEITYDGEGSLTGYQADNGFAKQLFCSQETGTYTENYSYQGEERKTALYTEETEEGTQLHALLSNGLELVTDSSETEAARYLTDGIQDTLLEKKSADEDGLVTELANFLGTCSYKYDISGNLESIFRDGKELSHYIYDKNGQLLQHYDYEAGLVYEYTYDDNYNILGEVIRDLYGNITEQNLYEYGSDAALGLQQYNGKTITYDASGNPISYHNGWSLSWMGGRMLEGITARENEITYTYNSAGIRTGKKVNGTETEYLLDENNRMMGEKCGEGLLWYLYDGEGELSGFEWKGTDYYYIKNAMGDVQGIADREGNVLCTYHYDVWGALTGVEGDKELAERNPIRYRGYYYDGETGFYYLNTRYYDPEVKRFLNRDLLDNETNLYQYCYNNPVVNADDTGLTAYSCTDGNVSFVNNVSGYSRRETWDKTIQSYRAEYHNGSQYAHFNCYLWALGIIVVDKNNFDAFTQYGNKKMGVPGYWCNDIRGLQTGDDINAAVGYTRRDLAAKGYRVISVTQNTPSYSSSRHVLAVKMRMAGVNWDYHFMRLRKSEQQWSFKAGWYGPVFRLNAGLKPNQITWYGYSCKDGKTWKPDNGIYNGALYYISYK